MNGANYIASPGRRFVVWPFLAGAGTAVVFGVSRIGMTELSAMPIHPEALRAKCEQALAPLIVALKTFEQRNGRYPDRATTLLEQRYLPELPDLRALTKQDERVLAVHYQASKSGKHYFVAFRYRCFDDSITSYTRSDRNGSWRRIKYPPDFDDMLRRMDGYRTDDQRRERQAWGLTFD